ncbi:Hsp20 family protein [Reyranella sp.]|jgi:molecular chaperone IbpA|uniref:Hsp20 family protein n=1 Tax=Reyranella sp. TaxID=1929291 RepID=UPI0040375789
MRSTIDFAPFYRGTVGFDRVFDLLDSVASRSGTNGYPPYDIEKTGDDSYRIVMAVAGFTEAELNVMQKENELLIGGKSSGGEDKREYLHRGIASRDFERTFQLADHVRVVDARLANGLLTVDLRREVPEEKKPRVIAIEKAAPRASIARQ